MPKKVSLFGVRGAGKTCYIYAMSQVMQAGATYNGTTISIIANNIAQQNRLNRGYTELANSVWPMGSMHTTVFDFKVRLQHDNEYQEIIPSLLLRDYRGGLLQSEEDDDEEFNELLDSFSDSCSIVFLVDGGTLLDALDPLDVEPEHREPKQPKDVLVARNQISFVDNLFSEYKKRNATVPPVLIAITKSDIFISPREIENGKKLIKQYIPSVFANGSEIDAAITSLSLGDNLSKGSENQLYGQLVLNTSRNIHIPMIYSLYAYLDSVYDGSPEDEKKYIDSVLYTLRRMFEGQVDMYISGKPAFENK